MQQVLHIVEMLQDPMNGYWELIKMVRSRSETEWEAYVYEVFVMPWDTNRFLSSGLTGIKWKEACLLETIFSIDVQFAEIFIYAYYSACKLIIYCPKD